MKKKTWGIAVAAVVVLAAAGTATALMVSGGRDGDYTALPTCDKLSAALPGKPPLKAGQNVTHAEDFRGLHPAFTNIDCRADDDPAQVHVELYQPSDMDLVLMHQYADKTVHDGAWRAKAMFDRQTMAFDPLSSDVRYGSNSYSNARCTVMTLKRNATVMVTLLNTAPRGATPDQWKAACRQIAEKQVPKVVDAALS